MCNKLIMKLSIPEIETIKWAIIPARQCVNFIAEETRIATLLHRSIIALSNQDKLLYLAHQHIKELGNDLTGINKLISDQVWLGKSAKEMISNDFDPINRNGIVGMWVAIEVAIEDTAILILRKDKSVLELLSKAGVKLPKSITNPLIESDAHKVYKRLEQFSRKNRSVAEAYIHSMSVLNIFFTLPIDIIKTLSELNYVRNCILHRGGVLDERAHIEAPNLSSHIGENYKISNEKYMNYFEAVSKFSIELLDGVGKSPYVRRT